MVEWDGLKIMHGDVTLELYDPCVVEEYHLSQVLHVSRRTHTAPQRHYVIRPLRSTDTRVLIHHGECVSSAVTVPADEVPYGQAANVRHSGVKLRHRVLVLSKIYILLQHNLLILTDSLTQPSPWKYTN